MKKSQKLNWILLPVGLLMIVGSVYALKYPDKTFSTLSILLGVAALLIGIVLIISFYLAKEQTSKVKMSINLISGVLLVIAGVILFLRPLFAQNISIYIIGLWSVVFAISCMLKLQLLRQLAKWLFIAGLFLNILLLAAGVLLIINALIEWLPIYLVSSIAIMISGVVSIIYSVINLFNYTKNKNSQSS
jgi:uncharacterized membrane protein HdeD (DUF308 family)